ncbi:MAG: hypothetical protein V7782_13485 [Psychromonas sp.]
MKNQINLYHQSLFPKRQLATFKQFAVLLSICLVSLLLLNLILGQQASSMQEKIQSQQNGTQQKQQQLTQLLARLQSQRAPQSKLRELSALEAEIAGKQRLLRSLSGVELAELVSFSDLMRGLSLANIDNLSIDQFSVLEGRLNITGKARKSDSVPLWLTKVQATDELSKIAFTQLNLHDKKSYFLFNLTNGQQPLALGNLKSLQNNGDKR